MFKEFLKFLKEFNVMALAIAFILGMASTALVKSLVDDIIMPILSPMLSGEGWQSATLNMGPVSIAYGSFLAELVNFVILALVVFLVAKKILKMEEIPKK